MIAIEISLSAIAFLAIGVALFANYKEGKEWAVKSKLDYVESNRIKTTFHRRKSSSSWARTGILFKNK